MRQIIDAVFKKLNWAHPEVPFSVRFWDGQESYYGQGPEKFRLVIRSETAIKRILSGGTLAFGEEYMYGNIDVEGDLQAMASLHESWNSASQRLPLLFRLAGKMRGFLPQSIDAARKNIHYHYDIGNDFYALWLDKTMTYSCAYFKQKENSLETAQKDKYDHICRKLRIKPGQTLVDIGCGWGGMMFYAAEHYGAKCVGYTLSENQFAYIKSKLKSGSYDNRVEVYLDDYRKAKGNFDKFVSIGMFEHVGKSNYGEFFSVIKRILKPQGAGVLHTIAQTFDNPNDPWVEKYIFPGGYLPTLAMISDSMARAGLILQDIEDLRPHYGITLDRWARNFENNSELIRKTIVDHLRDEKAAERFMRMWRLYLNASAVTFKTAGNRLYQGLFTNGVDTQWPLTRDYIYHF